MTITRTERLGLYRWSSDDDQIIREHIDLSHQAIEDYGAKIISGQALPSVGSAQYARTFFINTSDSSLYFYDSEDAFGKWNPINTNVILVTLAENKGDILVATGPGEWDILPVGNRNQVLTVLDSSANIGWATLLVNKGDLLAFDGASLTNKPVGTNSNVLFLNASEATGLAWGLVDTPSIANNAATTQKFANSSVIADKFSSQAATASKFALSSVTTPKISDSAVSDIKILDLSATAVKFNDGSVTEIKFANSSVTATKFAASSVVASKILNLAVTGFEIASFSVNGQKLGPASITTEKIIDQNVITTNFADGAVTEEKLFDGSVTSEKIADNAVTGQKIADGAIGSQKIADLTIGQIHIAPGGVTAAKIADLAVTTDKIANLAVTSAKIGNAAVTAEKIQNLAVTGSKIALNAVGSGVLRKSEALSVIGNPSSSSADVVDVVATSNNTVLQRLSGSVGFSQLATESIANDAITTPKVKDLTVTDIDVSSSANINLAKLGPGTLPSTITTTAPNYVNGSVTRPKLGSIGIWQSYTPVVYVANIGFLNSFSYPGSIVLSSKYTVNSARYVQLGELVLVNVRITIKSSYGYSEDSVVSVSLPIVPSLANMSVIGEGYYQNADTYRNGRVVKAAVNTTRNLATFILGNGSSSIANFDESAVDGITIPLYAIPILEQDDFFSISAQYPVVI